MLVTIYDLQTDMSNVAQMMTPDFDGVKTLLEKEKMLFISIFFFSY